MIVTIVVSMVKPDNFDWNVFNRLEQVKDVEDKVDFDPSETDPAKIDAASKFAYISYLLLTLLLLIIWPIPMYATGYVFSKTFFAGWVIFGLIWAIVASAIVSYFLSNHRIQNCNSYYSKRINSRCYWK
jgi:hypothetical protein